MSSPNWDLFGVRFAGNLLVVRWVSGGSLLWVRQEFVGISLEVRWESTGSSLWVHCESAGSPLGVCWEFIKWSLQKSSPNELFTWALQVRSPNEITKLQPGWVYWEPIRSLLGVWRENDLPIEYYQFPKQFFKWTLKMGSLKKLSKWALQIETCLLVVSFAGSLVEVWWVSGRSPVGVQWESWLRNIYFFFKSYYDLRL